MEKQNHQEEIKRIRSHVRILNLTGMASIGALMLAGYLMISDSDKVKINDKNALASAVTSHKESPIFDISSATSKNIKEVAEKSAVAENQTNHAISEDKHAESKSAKSRKAELTSLSKGNSIGEELQSFEASCDNGSVLFNWVTLGSPKYAYEIEKAMDKEHFEVFVRAPQPEKKDGKNFYSVEESTSMEEVAFYRLRKVVGKGKYEYSEPVQVICSKALPKAASVDVFPNGYGSFRVVINSPKADNFKVSLYDINNTELASEQYEAVEGSNEFVLTSSSIERGNYILKVTNGSMVKEKKVVLK